jgi:hypothetical protein
MKLRCNCEPLSGMCLRSARRILWLVLACLPVAAQAATEATEKPGGFAALVKGATARQGLFDTYEKGDHLYLAVPAGRLGREFALVPRLSRGIGAAGLFGGLLFDRQAASLVAFERHGDRVFLVKRPHRFTAAAGSTEATAVGRSIGDSVLQSSPVLATRDDGAVVVDIYEWVVTDLSNVDRFVRLALGHGPDKPGQAALDRARSHLLAVKAFPGNVEISARLTFTPSEPPKLDSLPDARFLPLELHYSLVALPDPPMTPRLADERVGYIVTARKDFSRTEETYFVRYANRWRLEPGERAGELYLPKKPIVYYLDPSIPERLRPYVKAGIEEWNRAFEVAGFRGAIHAEPLPEGADPDDIRYATVRWITSDRSDFGAIGPSIVDPRTGEILDADVLIESGLVLGASEDWRYLNAAQSLAALLDPAAVPSAASASSLELPAFAQHLAVDSLVARSALAAGALGGSAEIDLDQYVAQLVKWVAMHEVGHTLGLDHNFRASSATPLARLGDRAWTRLHGIAASVMDYTPVNLARSGSGLGDLYDVTVGDYDRWAIAYGYTPDPARARELAREGALPGHQYGSEDDLRAPGAIDPSNDMFDLSDDPVGWAAGRWRLLRALFARLPAIALQDDKSYARLTRVVAGFLEDEAMTFSPAVKSIGGQYKNLDHVGDPAGRPPFAAVPRDQELVALAFLDEAAFGPGAFTLPPELLRLLGATGWEHWGFDNTFDGRLDFPYLARVLEIEKVLLRELTSPQRLGAIRDGELKFGASSVLTLPELFDHLTRTVWQEVVRGEAASLPPLRRDLERAYLDRMTELLFHPPDEMPGDAVALARSELRFVRSRIDHVLSRPQRLDAYTAAHLRDSRERIERALAPRDQPK